jgi:hypothetical protein
LAGLALSKEVLGEDFIDLAVKTPFGLTSLDRGKGGSLNLFLPEFNESWPRLTNSVSSMMVGRAFPFSIRFEVPLTGKVILFIAEELRPSLVSAEPRRSIELGLLLKPLQEPSRSMLIEFSRDFNTDLMPKGSLLTRD